jgi:ATP synthase protein I
VSDKYLILKNQSGLQYARRFFYMQVIATLSLTVFFSMFGAKAAWSSLLGGCVSALPNIFFARKLFADQRAMMSKQIVMRFYQGEAMKIILSGLLFVVVFLFMHVTTWVFFVTYIVTQMMSLVFPLFFHRIL